MGVNMHDNFLMWGKQTKGTTVVRGRVAPEETKRLSFECIGDHEP